MKSEFGHSAETYFRELKKVIESLDFEQISRLVGLIWGTYKKGGTIFFIGNGGSASTASHLAADIGKNTVIDVNNPLERRIRAIALTDNAAWLLALGNDLGYERIFVEQLKNIARMNDLLVVISGSGNSENIVRAVEWANVSGVTTAGLLGFDGGRVKDMLKLAVVVPVAHYGYVEGVHSEIHHFLVETLKRLKSDEK